MVARGPRIVEAVVSVCGRWCECVGCVGMWYVWACGMCGCVVCRGWRLIMVSLTSRFLLLLFLGVAPFTGPWLVVCRRVGHCDRGVWSCCPCLPGCACLPRKKLPSERERAVSGWPGPSSLCSQLVSAVPSSTSQGLTATAAGQIPNLADKPALCSPQPPPRAAGTDFPLTCLVL